jgi:hypothetical protein|tara:strand:- start:33 stop:227 length:195 start_codon:yes stop_codon:yes gene_type:complete
LNSDDGYLSFPVGEILIVFFFFFFDEKEEDSDDEEHKEQDRQTLKDVNELIAKFVVGYRLRRAF